MYNFKKREGGHENIVYWKKLSVMSESIGKAEKFVNTQLKNSNALSNESQRKIEKTKINVCVYSTILLINFCDGINIREEVFKNISKCTI